MKLVRRLVAERGLPSRRIARARAVRRRRAPESVDLSGFGAVVFAGGFRPDYASGSTCPGAFDAARLPDRTTRARARRAAGLYFVGVHFLRKRKSSLLIGVGEDAALVAARDRSVKNR